MSFLDMFYHGQELVLPCCHGLGIIPSTPFARTFWKARGFTGTGADCSTALGLSPRHFPWECLFMAAAVSAVLTWCCATADHCAQGTQAPCDARVAALLAWARAVNQPCSYPKKQAYSVFIDHIQQLQVALAASCWCSVECFPLLDILRLCVTNQQWEVHTDLRGLFNIFCAPDALTMSNNAQVWSFKGGNGNWGPTFITGFYIPQK